MESSWTGLLEAQRTLGIPKLLEGETWLGNRLWLDFTERLLFLSFSQDGGDTLLLFP